MKADASEKAARPDEKAVSVSEFPYPGNEAHRPHRVGGIGDGVSLWWCDLGDDFAPLATFSSWLSAHEHARARRYGSEALARRYIRGRAALRWILGRALGIAPERVPIERGHRGRPNVASAELDFNVSNTLDVAFIGVARTPGMRIGVDVESAARALNHAGLARKFLTAREREMLATMDDDAKRLAFLRSWTCKEAMSKATGDALSAPLGAMDVELSPRLRLRAGPSPYLAADWRLHAADVPAGFLATVALWQPPPEGMRSAAAATLDKVVDSR